MRPTWLILPVETGYVVAWRDLSGAYGEFTADEPLRLLVRMYRDYRQRRGGRLYLLRLLNVDDTQEIAPLKVSQRKLRTEEYEAV